MLLETSRDIKGFGRYTLQNVNNKGADQTAWMRRLVCACVVRMPHFVSQIDGSNRPLKQIFNNYKIKSSRFCLKIYYIIGITHVFSCINICQVPRKLFEHEAFRPSVQTSSEGPGKC